LGTGPAVQQELSGQEVACDACLLQHRSAQLVLGVRAHTGAEEPGQQLHVARRRRGVRHQNRSRVQGLRVHLHGLCALARLVEAEPGVGLLSEPPREVVNLLRGGGSRRTSRGSNPGA